MTQREEIQIADLVVNPEWKTSEQILTLAIVDDDVITKGASSAIVASDANNQNEGGRGSFNMRPVFIQMENGNAMTFNSQQDGSIFQKSNDAEESEFEALPTVRAISKGDHRLLLECFKQGESPTSECKKSGRTLMHVTVSSCCPNRENDWVPMVYQLSNFESKVNAKDNSGTTPVRIAIARRLPQILAALLKCGAELTAEDEYLAEEIKGVIKKDIDDVIKRLTPCYWSAVLDPTPFKVSRLVRAWSRINITNSRGQTLIEFARQNEQVNAESVSELLSHEASVELAHAVMAGDADRARVFLCDQSADLDTCDTSVKDNYYEPFAPLTLAGAAVKLGHREVLALLREAHKEKEAGRSHGTASYSKASLLNSAILSPTHNAKGPVSPKKANIATQPNVTSAMCVIL